uniref:Uncharacterized protein n=1 Tax=Ananas comosus var. bracteatus TaxID=296719 RepID=A0A6V7PP09_ANACO|nr:unnamed protein product [Ananas comosus var. bracteatus]
MCASSAATATEREALACTGRPRARPTLTSPAPPLDPNARRPPRAPAPCVPRHPPSSAAELGSGAPSSRQSFAAAAATAQRTRPWRAAAWAAWRGVGMNKNSIHMVVGAVKDISRSTSLVRNFIDRSNNSNEVRDRNLGRKDRCANTFGIRTLMESSPTAPAVVIHALATATINPSTLEALIRSLSMILGVILHHSLDCSLNARFLPPVPSALAPSQCATMSPPPRTLARPAPALAPPSSASSAAPTTSTPSRDHTSTPRATPPPATAVPRSRPCAPRRRQRRNCKDILMSFVAAMDGAELVLVEGMRCGTGAILGTGLAASRGAPAAGMAATAAVAVTTTTVATTN